jgi:hypothetical protein
MDFLRLVFAACGTTNMVSPKMEFAHATTTAKPNAKSELFSAVTD